MKDHMLVIAMPEEATMSANTESGNVQVPLYNIPMMTDERWNELDGKHRSEGRA